jgi:phage tail-like protein
MAAQPGSIIRPHPAFRFLVECADIVSAVFSECSGLKAEVEVFKYEEGGENEFVHQLPGRRKWSNITLKRGMTDSLDLWTWYQETIAGSKPTGNSKTKGHRRDLTIILHNEAHEKAVRWELEDAYPVRWEGPALKVDGNAVAIEALEITYRRFKMKLGPGGT